MIFVLRIVRISFLRLLLRTTGVESGRLIDGATREDVRVLRGAISGRDVHHSHAPRQPLLRRQPHRSLLPHLPRLVSRLLSAGRVRRQSQSRDNHSSRPCLLPEDGRRNDAANARRYSYTRYCYVGHEISQQRLNTVQSVSFSVREKASRET